MNIKHNSTGGLSYWTYSVIIQDVMHNNITLIAAGNDIYIGQGWNKGVGTMAVNVVFVHSKYDSLSVESQKGVLNI